MTEEVKDGGAVSPDEKIRQIRARQVDRMERSKAQRKGKRLFHTPGEILGVYEGVTKDCEYLLKTVDRLQSENARLTADALFSARSSDQGEG